MWLLIGLLIRCWDLLFSHYSILSVSVNWRLKRSKAILELYSHPCFPLHSLFSLIFSLFPSFTNIIISSGVCLPCILSSFYYLAFKLTSGPLFHRILSMMIMYAQILCSPLLFWSHSCFHVFLFTHIWVCYLDYAPRGLRKSFQLLTIREFKLQNTGNNGIRCSSLNSLNAYW